MANWIGSVSSPLAIVVANYRAVNGHYPEKLDDLAPKYMPALPDDAFARPPRPIQYRREADAYALWATSPWPKPDDRKTDASGPDEQYDLILRPVPVKSEEN
jgi:hypothetical protein